MLFRCFSLWPSSRSSSSSSSGSSSNRVVVIVLAVVLIEAVIVAVVVMAVVIEIVGRAVTSAPLNRPRWSIGKNQSTAKIRGKRNLSLSNIVKKLVYNLNSWITRFVFEFNLIQNVRLFVCFALFVIFNNIFDTQNKPSFTVAKWA